MEHETLRPAFAGRDRPLLSYGTAFPAATARHVTETFGAARVYVICSGSLARNTPALEELTSALGPDKIAGRRIGMQSHTLWSEVLEIVNDARNVQADLLLTLGAGSLTDGAKIIALVRHLCPDTVFLHFRSPNSPGSGKRHPHSIRARNSRPRA